MSLEKLIIMRPGQQNFTLQTFEFERYYVLHEHPSVLAPGKYSIQDEIFM